MVLSYFSRVVMSYYSFFRIGSFLFHFLFLKVEDDKISRRMRLLEFLTPAALDIKPELQNEMVFGLARDELRKINSYRTPGEKIECVVKCAAVIFRSLTLASLKESEEGSQCGADDFLPLFIWVVLRSHVPKLVRIKDDGGKYLYLLTYPGNHLNI